MKEKYWTIQIKDHEPVEIFGSLRYTDTMLTIYEYDPRNYEEYTVYQNNPNTPTQLHFYPLHMLVGFWAKP